MGLRLEGYVDNGRGEPAADIPAVVTRLTDGTVVESGITDSDGHWLFDDLPTADEYLVTLSDSAGNAVSRAPWSGELRSAWVRDRLDVGGLPVLVDPAVDNSLAWTATGLYVPPGLTLGAADARYVNADGDVIEGDVEMTGSFVLNGAALDRSSTSDNTLEWLSDGFYVPPSTVDLSDYLTQTEGDARYPLKTDLDPYPTYLTSAEADALFLTPAEGNAAYSTTAHAHDATYVNTTGDTMSGALTISSGALTISSGGLFIDAGGASITGNVGVSGNASVNGTLGAGGLVTASAGLSVTGAATISTTLDVTGVTTLRDSLILPQSGVTLELGHPTAANNPVIDFRSSGNVVNFDTRIGSSGGTGVGGNGTLTITAASTVISGTATINGAANITGNLNLSGVTTLLEIGAQGVTNTPGIDFHSSASVTDYDVRVLCSGGTASAGAGTLTISAATVAITGGLNVTGTTNHTGNVGFYGTAAIAKPTVSGARASNVALTNLLTQLAALGLITNSTTT